MKKLIAFALALILALTLPFTAAADWETIFSKRFVQRARFVQGGMGGGGV